jgi:hypothetical protein
MGYIQVTLGAVLGKQTALINCCGESNATFYVDLSTAVGACSAMVVPVLLIQPLFLGDSQVSFNGSFSKLCDRITIPVNGSLLAPGRTYAGSIILHATEPDLEVRGRTHATTMRCFFSPCKTG